MQSDLEKSALRLAKVMEARTCYYKTIEREAFWWGVLLGVGIGMVIMGVFVIALS